MYFGFYYRNNGHLYKTAFERPLVSICSVTTMLNGTSLLILIACVLAVTSATAWAPEVHTVQGKLRGRVVDSFSGKQILSYIGVRFAEPPVGEHRFKPPVPVKPWDGVRNATEDGPRCAQRAAAGVVTSEDCLFLNVHTKSLTSRLPVIVYFHPGGFVGGTGNSHIYGPQYFLDKDIVLVTVNYRLGPFGFLSTDDEVLPGNNGLKDQLAAMRWVHHNIARFGGDPQTVTLFGYSAGAGSVQLHMVSPLSRGLFHRAISSSCSATTPSVLNRDPVTLARRFASLFKCSTDSSRMIRECLMRQSKDEILDATTKIWDTLQVPFSLFAPIIEKNGGEERFLRDDPVKLFKSGQFSHLPLITGITRDEFNWRAQYLLTNSTYVERLTNDFEKIAPWEFHYPREPQDLSHRMSAAFKKFYLDDLPVTNRSEEKLGQLYGDSLISFSVVQASKLIAAKSSAPVYFYRFNFEGRFSYRYSFGTKKPYGVVHHDDLIYLFYTPSYFPLFNQTDPEAFMVHTLTSIYSEFAKTGIPTLPNTSQKWLPITPHQLRHLELTKPLAMREGLPYPDRMGLWESLLPIDQPYRQIFY